MASSSTIQIIDDDDDFDWEAAVEVIDAACQATINPNSNNNLVHKPPISTKQSTLDKFIGIRTPKPQLDDLSNVTGSSYRNSEFVQEEGNNGIKIDPEAAKTWIYPVNVPLRDYQFAITKTSLFSNTLVTLPTGLGKTLIAAVVMYNYFRWFPEGKIVFTAPSKPLVMQQIEACHNIVGIPQEWTIDLTGEMSPSNRVSFWEAKRVFFVTPQVLEKDIESGKCLVERIVCLVIDEAHRATGNYSYCVVVRKLIADNVQLRILALSATPGSKHLDIQKIIDNLQISTLEYRNESDHDVLPYVHEKKIELIKVALGQDVVDLDNLLSEVIAHNCKKLCSLGVLHIRDSQTLSPFKLLALKAKYLEVPPGNVPHTRHGDILADFALLFKLVHMRKLLTNYGIGPALEMLEDNLKEQRNTLNRLNRSEAFQKFRILMQQSSCSGASSPKLSKMLEVLIDHFKTSDPLNSRVIIFSNYRGSVRAIMEALANIGHIVKATQFIGQSSAFTGKTSKGQSQKIQQEVLQKFRAGGYNVIVATSIGEEGLDIMEVDLVLCFDANVSPLRMVQRMGRTGRNHAGRVVVLACEGPEYNSYLRKQKSCQNLYKHFRNGGRNGFNFCNSPRMIPHIYKPEVQYVELSIKQFIPRGKKVLDDHTVQMPTFEAKLNNMEMELLGKFFQPKDNLWRPSLIAFPHFQAFPSRVHNVMHSFRSEMLIDAMQHLQGSLYSRDSGACVDQVEANSDLSASVETVEQHDSFMNEVQTFHDPENDNSQREVSESHVSPLNPSKMEENRCFTRSRGATTHVHSYLFGSDFVSVDVLGRVLVLSVPLPPLKDVHSKCTRTAGLQNCYKQDAAQVGDLLAECGIEIKQANHFNATPTVQEGNGMVDVEFLDSDTQQGKSVDVDFSVSQTLVCSRKLVKEEISEALPVGVNRTALILSDDSGNDFEDAELSPRLTSLLKSGVVPESPNDTGTSEHKWKDEIVSQDCDSTSKVHIEPTLPVIVMNDIVIKDNNAYEDLPSFANEIRSSEIDGNNVSAVNCAVFPVMEEIRTPAENPLHNSSSEEWHFTSGDNADSVKNGQKFKRLRKYGDILKKRPRETNQYESTIDAAKLGKSTCSYAHKRGRGEKRMAKDVRVFIEEQAEVSAEIPVSEDEDEEENNSYNDSFIDDRINPTAGCTSAEDSGRDMMAIYRRSLLSQSPMGRLPISFMDGTPDSLANRTQINYSGSSEGTDHSLRTPQAGLYSESTSRNPASSRLNPEKNSTSMFYKNNDTQKEDESIVGSRKRKLSSCQGGPLPVQNLEGKFLLQSEVEAKDRSYPDCMNKDNPVNPETEFDDDEFYDGIDLDALEEQATIYLRSKSILSTRNQMKNPEPQNDAALPSFDLGI